MPPPHRLLCTPHAANAERSWGRFVFRLAAPLAAFAFLTLIPVHYASACQKQPDCGTVPDPTYVVHGQDELAAALKKIRGGDTIELRAGTYGNLVREAPFEDAEAANPVTLRAAGDGPVIFNQLTLQNTGQVVLDGLTFSYEYKNGDGIRARPFIVQNSDDVTIRRATFAGDVPSDLEDAVAGFGAGYGLVVEESDGFTLEDSTAYNFYKAFLFRGSSDLRVAGNEVHTIRSDGLNFITVDGAVIENNYIHDFNALSSITGDHPDMIQFWTARETEPTLNVVIRNNILDAGDGVWTQTIFMRNEKAEEDLAADPENERMFYRNIAITGNVIINAHLHGITLGEVNGLTIANNTLIRTPAAVEDGMSMGHSTPSIIVADASSDVEIRSNVLQGGLPKARPGWVVEGNFRLRQTNDGNGDSYDENFVNALGDLDPGLDNYMVLPDSALARSGAGAPILAYDGAEPTLRAVPALSEDPDVMNRILVDGLLSSGNGLSYQWDFGDGTQSTRAQDSHLYGTPGTYDVTLTVTDDGGQSNTTRAAVTIATPVYLHHDPSSGRWSGTIEKMPERAAALEGSSFAIGTAGGRSPVEFRADLLAPFFGSGAFRMDFELRAARRGSSGELLRVHEVLLARVSDTGNLTVSFTNDAGQTAKVTLRGTGLGDGAWHKLTFDFDSDARTFTATYNDRFSQSAIIGGKVPSKGSHGLVFGNPWGKASFDGEIRGLTLTDTEREFLPATQ